MLGGHLEVGLPQLHAGSAALVHGGAHLVVGGAVVEAEAVVLVVEAVEHDGATCDGNIAPSGGAQRLGKLAQVPQRALG